MSEDEQVVAYDAEGQPLFHHKGTAAPEAAESKVKKEEVDGSLTKLKHDRSLREFPSVKLDDDEYVEMSVERHKLGYVLIWAVAGAVVIAMLITVIIALFFDNYLPGMVGSGADGYIAMACVAVLALAGVSGYIATVLFRDNQFIVTNKKVEQHIVRGLFNKTIQTINLVMIEDISYTQSGFFQYLFDFGKIRLSTIGDETTYTFTFVKDPDQQAKDVTKIVEETRKRTMANNVTGPGVTFNVGSS
ncbi:MAG: PH domain-containing protein [Candidatus Nomurabacteria bacterium]|jgi:uncharacterized membrane protein YdbT with pleckstrin-like domain|nr:PH domain-containing protein [Candidatus Nomurabacteria bacterium]